VILGTGGAWLCHRHRFRYLPILNTLILVPMLIPEIIMGISLLIFFTICSNYGNQFLEHLGIQTDPLGLGFTTVIISHVTFCFPFVLVGIQARLSGLDPSLEEAAMDLGATPTQALMKVIIPYLMPAILSGALMSFTLSLDELIVTYFTTGPQSVTLPIRIFGMAKVGLNPMLNAISTVIIVSTVPLIIWAGLINRDRGRNAAQNSTN
jgi:spermidine/putrescine transport system permease protein